MLAMMSDYTGLEKFFAVSAIIGGVLFVIRLILQFIGGDTDLDTDLDTDTDADFDSSGSDLSFKVLSFQGLTAFFTMFGLVGLALLRQSGWEPVRAIVVASAAGFGTTWLLKWMFNAAKGLQASGTIKMKNAIGQEGEVYLSIPADGVGKVRVTVQDHLKVWSAVSHSKQEIKTDRPIRVVKVIANNMLVVEEIN